MMMTCLVCGKRFHDRRSLAKFCSGACRVLNERAVKQAKNTGAGKGWALGAERAPRQICQKCGSRFYAEPKRVGRGQGKYCSAECRIAAMAANPESYPKTSGRRGRGGKREDLGGVYFRSAWEANYARYLNWLVSLNAIAGWEYEPETFQFDDIKRGCRFYTPDFKVSVVGGRVEYHEVKGYMDQRSATKLKRFMARYPEKTLILIEKNQYQEIAKKVSAMIPGWEGRIRAG